MHSITLSLILSIWLNLSVLSQLISFHFDLLILYFVHTYILNLSSLSITHLLHYSVSPFLSSLMHIWSIIYKRSVTIPFVKRHTHQSISIVNVTFNYVHVYKNEAVVTKNRLKWLIKLPIESFCSARHDGTPLLITEDSKIGHITPLKRCTYVTCVRLFCVYLNASFFTSRLIFCSTYGWLLLYEREVGPEKQSVFKLKW